MLCQLHLSYGIIQIYLKKRSRVSNQLMNMALRNCFTKNAAWLTRGCSNSRRQYTNLALLSDEHRMMRETCRDFANNELVPIAGVTDKEHKFPSEAIKGMGDLGLLSVAIDSEYGGTGLDYVAYAIAMEEISRGCASAGVIMTVQNTLYCLPVEKHGTHEQKEKYLRPFATGEKIGCFGLSILEW